MLDRNVTLKHADPDLSNYPSAIYLLSIYLSLQFPQVYPTAHYRITITNGTGDYVTTKVGHNLMSGLLISERITSRLSLNQNYSLTLIAENFAGSNTPVTIHFSEPIKTIAMSVK